MLAGLIHWTVRMGQIEEKGVFDLRRLMKFIKVILLIEKCMVKENHLQKIIF